MQESEREDAEPTWRDLTTSPDLAVLARLLLVGAGGWLLLGALTLELSLQLDHGFRVPAEFAGGGLAAGAFFGPPIGVLVQALNAAGLHLVRRTQPEVPFTTLRQALVVLPAAAAVLLALVATSTAGQAWWVRPLAVLLAGGAAAALTWATAPWCLAPVRRRDGRVDGR